MSSTAQNPAPTQAPPAPVPLARSPVRWVGARTTEILLVVATEVAIVTSALVDVLPPKWAALSSSIAVGAYAVSRGLAKVGSAGAR